MVRKIPQLVDFTKERANRIRAVPDGSYLLFTVPEKLGLGVYLFAHPCLINRYNKNSFWAQPVKDSRSLGWSARVKGGINQNLGLSNNMCRVGFKRGRVCEVSRKKFKKILGIETRYEDSHFLIDAMNPDPNKAKKVFDYFAGKVLKKLDSGLSTPKRRKNLGTFLYRDFRENYLLY